VALFGAVQVIRLAGMMALKRVKKLAIITASILTSTMIINANALHIPLADKCIHTIVTSPPYYGLRDYNVAGQLGLEPTPDEYIANLVEVFRECKRILRDDGTLFVNMGDSYAGSGNGSNDYRDNGASISKNDNKYKGQKPGFDFGRQGATSTVSKLDRGRGTYSNNVIKPKDLIGIPWMLAFALRADGWYLRSDIIWAKKNCMPESVKDRPTKSHEYIFMLSKSARYYYDNEAVKEPYASEAEPPRDRSSEGYNDSFAGGRWSAGTRDYYANGGRNKRDVWFVSTKPYKGAHYATFNPELITPCILAGAPEGGIVFDPFVGSGTTVATAIQLGRRGIGLDLSMKYLAENAKTRIDEMRLPLLELVK
jgi:DNA modification methylase